jgi:2-hydroxy-3-oxopropionate reductase
MRVAVLGAGSLGRGFAASLVRGGFVTTVFDTSETAVESATAVGATAVGSVAELALDADVLVVALPDTPQILEALGGVEGHLQPGGLVLVMSTVAPETVVELGARLAPAGVDVLDCPVSGGPGRAERGELAIMVGGGDEAFTRARGVLDALGSSVVHVGPLGHGAITKLANNLMGAVIVEGIAEGLAFAARAGVDVQRAAEAIAGGSGSSWILREWVPETVFRGDYAKRFSLDLMCKDMRIVEAMAAALGVAVPACAVAREAFERAVAEGHGDEDFSRAIALHAERSGARLS